MKNFTFLPENTNGVSKVLDFEKKNFIIITLGRSPGRDRDNKILKEIRSRKKNKPQT
jgi:hypothetical protein